MHLSPKARPVESYCVKGLNVKSICWSLSECALAGSERLEPSLTTVHCAAASVNRSGPRDWATVWLAGQSTSTPGSSLVTVLASAGVCEVHAPEPSVWSARQQGLRDMPVRSWGISSRFFQISHWSWAKKLPGKKKSGDTRKSVPLDYCVCIGDKSPALHC